MCETPRFIAMVENYECLWKRSFRNNLEAKRQAWDEIAEKMYGYNWKTFSSSDKLAAKTELRKKWKNIKDSFIKDIKYQKHNKSGVGNKKKAKYAFFDSLMFLMPEVEIRNRFKFVDNDSCTNIIEQESLKEDNECDSYSFEDRCESPSLSKEDDPSSTVPKLSSAIKRPQSKAKLTSVQFRSRLLKILAQQKNEKSNCSHDDDESFFHSLLPIVRKLDEQQKIQFRMEVLNSLRNIRTTGTIPQQPALNVGAMSHSQSYYPLTQHQLQIYSLPSTQTDLSTSSNDHSQQHSSVVNVSNSSQMHNLSISDGINSRKNQDVQVFSNVL